MINLPPINKNIEGNELVCLSALSAKFYKLIKHLGHEDPHAREVNEERSDDASCTGHHAATSHGPRPENERGINAGGSRNRRRGEHR